MVVSTTQKAMTRPKPQPCPPHHWLLATPSGKPTVRGRCRKCGAKREGFPVAFDPETMGKGYQKLRLEAQGDYVPVVDTGASLRRNPLKIKYYR